MTDKLSNLLQENESRKFAIATGQRMHDKMRHIMIDGDIRSGDPDILKSLLAHPDLVPFFGPDSQTEVPIAGYVRGKFISRRTDRMIVNHKTKTVLILDYKSDVNKTAFYNNYVAQIQEYRELMHEIYPNYTVRGFILWLHDFSLQQV